MLKKIIVMFLVFAATALFGMSLSQLNSATKAELMEINGIGEVKAAAIIKERRKGKFKSFDDLASRVEGIGAQTAANVKNGVKSSADVKKVKKSSKKKTAKKKTSTKEKTAKKSTKKRKIKSMDEKKKALKSKAKKTKEKKTKSKKSKAKKEKKKKN